MARGRPPLSLRPREHKAPNGRLPPLAAPAPQRCEHGADTLQAWERFITGEPEAAAPLGNFVVSSWQRSLALGVNPQSRAAPLAAEGDRLGQLEERYRDLLWAAGEVMAEAADLFPGSRCIVLLTTPEGVVLDARGDTRTLDEGARINLMRGGDWREAVVGTNGIGTAIATRRPAQVHASEHFCEGIKRWTCAAAPICEPGTGDVLGVVDISGPPSTYQRANLALAVSMARRIEGTLAERGVQERARLLENCLARLTAADTAGLVAVDRGGRLVHLAGRVASPVQVGERVPGLARDVAVEEWAQRLPDGWRPEWFTPIVFGGRAIGAMLVVPNQPRAGGASRQALPFSEADPERCAFSHIIGNSSPIRALIARANLLAQRRVPVLIEGETGVGKELLARAIHGDASDGRPFIAFNCGAVSKELVAGELFGHVRGAFTGATSEGRLGRFELAHGGTLCLDEIGEMPLDVQPMLLRVLEEGVVYRLGDPQPRRVDVRLIAVTNRNLRREVEAGRFRRDLYYRIGVTQLTIPPLRERPQDIAPLIEHFNLRLAARHRVPARRFAPGVLAALCAVPWHGNVRELRNVVESLLLAGSDELVTLEDLPPEFLDAPLPAAAVNGASLPTASPGQPLAGDRAAPGPPAPDASPVRLEAVERETLRRALRRSQGNIADAARQLGISRSTLYRKMQRYRMDATLPDQGQA